jgi:hypothetical protein
MLNVFIRQNAKHDGKPTFTPCYSCFLRPAIVEWVTAGYVAIASPEQNKFFRLNKFISL